MMSQRTQYAVGIAFCAVVIAGLLAADGFFSTRWTLHHPLSGASSQMSDFGPPTRVAPIDPLRSVIGRDVLAEPVYVDARIPPFFQTAEVRAVFLNSAYDPSAAKIGLELPDGSLHFLPTTATVQAFDAGFALTARGDIARLPVNGRRYRFVLSLPGVMPERPVTVTEFTVTATRDPSCLFSLCRF